MDGLLCAEFLSRYNGSKVVGTYDKNILCLSDDVTIDECLFVDCDMNHADYVSIGNHMRLIGDSMSHKSFNPNVEFDVTTYTDKFPFATAFLISFATEVALSEYDISRMAYADSTLRNMISYSDNMRNWAVRMKHDAVDYIISNTQEAIDKDDALRQIYPNQSISSKRFGKKRYLEALNDGLEARSIDFLPLTKGMKFMADKVGINTVLRYNRDIMSYAEVYGGEYSVTYDQEIDWK